MRGKLVRIRSDVATHRRLRLGLLIGEVAEAAGVDVGTASRALRGLSVSIPTARAIAKALGLKYSSIVEIRPAEDPVAVAV